MSEKSNIRMETVQALNDIASLSEDQINMLRTYFKSLQSPISKTTSEEKKSYWDYPKVGVWGGTSSSYSTTIQPIKEILLETSSTAFYFKLALQTLIKLTYGNSQYGRLHNKLYYDLRYPDGVTYIKNPIIHWPEFDGMTRDENMQKCNVNGETLEYVECKQLFSGGSRKKNKSRISKKGRKTSKSNKRNRV